jgi:AcrR family transcriptional regulator
MPRVTKLPAERQDEILDAAQRLFWARGYDDTPVQALIDEVGIAKGTFYHHYPSKQALLQALIERMVRQAMALVEPLVEDPSVPAMDKLHRLFRRIGDWKAERREVLIELQKAMLADANAPMVGRLTRASTQAMAPQLGRVIAQGVAEGVFSVRHPVQTARIVLELGVVVSRALGESLLGLGPPLHELQPEVDAFHEAVERVLGTPPGSIHLIEPGLLDRWLAPPRPGEGRPR